MVGNMPNFTKYDILRCFVRLKENTGRQELSKELGLGEGTVRTILEMLKSKKLLDSTKKGHFLSRKGFLELNKIFKNVDSPKIIDIESIYPEYKKIGILLKKSGKLKETYKLRDIAVKNGAEGALILKFENKLHTPGSDYKGGFDNLEKYFSFKNGDIFVIAFADDARNAETGALAIAVELDAELKSFMKSFKEEKC